MNCPSRTDPVPDDGWNQSPNALNADATTRANFNHMANARLQRDHCKNTTDTFIDSTTGLATGSAAEDTISKSEPIVEAIHGKGIEAASPDAPICHPRGTPSNAATPLRTTIFGLPRRLTQILLKYAKFIGPGFMVAVAYIDPGRFILPMQFPFKISGNRLCNS